MLKDRMYMYGIRASAYEDMHRDVHRDEHRHVCGQVQRHEYRHEPWGMDYARGGMPCRDADGDGRRHALRAYSRMSRSKRLPAIKCSLPLYNDLSTPKTSSVTFWHITHRTYHLQ